MNQGIDILTGVAAQRTTLISVKLELQGHRFACPTRATHVFFKLGGNSFEFLQNALFIMKRFKGSSTILRLSLFVIGRKYLTFQHRYSSSHVVALAELRWMQSQGKSSEGNLTQTACPSTTQLLGTYKYRRRSVHKFSARRQEEESET